MTINYCDVTTPNLYNTINLSCRPATARPYRFLYTGCGALRCGASPRCAAPHRTASGVNESLFIGTRQGNAMWRASAVAPRQTVRPGRRRSINCVQSESDGNMRKTPPPPPPSSSKSAVNASSNSSHADTRLAADLMHGINAGFHVQSQRQIAIALTRYALFHAQLRRQKFLTGPSSVERLALTSATGLEREPCSWSQGDRNIDGTAGA